MPALESKDQTAILLMIREWENLAIEDYEMTPFFGTRNVNYSFARLYCAIGETQETIKYLKKSRAQGRFTGYAFYQYDRFLAPLHSHPEFQFFNRYGLK